MALHSSDQLVLRRAIVSQFASLAQQVLGAVDKDSQGKGLMIALDRLEVAAHTLSSKQNRKTYLEGAATASFTSGALDYHRLSGMQSCNGKRTDSACDYQNERRKDIHVYDQIAAPESLQDHCNTLSASVPLPACNGSMHAAGNSVIRQPDDSAAADADSKMSDEAYDDGASDVSSATDRSVSTAVMREPEGASASDEPMMACGVILLPNGSFPSVEDTTTSTARTHDAEVMPVKARWQKYTEQESECIRMRCQEVYSSGKKLTSAYAELARDLGRTPVSVMQHYRYMCSKDQQPQVTESVAVTGQPSPSPQSAKKRRFTAHEDAMLSAAFLAVQEGRERRSAAVKRLSAELGRTAMAITMQFSIMRRQRRLNH